MINWVALNFVAVFRDICCFAVDNCDYLFVEKYKLLQCVKYL